MEKPIVFFDGVCGLCNGFIDFLFRSDRSKLFLVASLQGKTASEKLPQRFTEKLDTFVLLENGEFFVRSEAVLRVLKRLPFPWSFFGVFLYLPAGFRDYFYRAIAKKRYILFGKKDSCRLPTSTERLQFLD